jgi:DNA-binding winged helix-turn-helix (wHTH) protein
MAETERYAFGPFTLEAAQRLVLRGSSVVPLPPKAVDALVILVRAAGRVVGRKELSAALWPDVYVSDNSLHQKVWLLRKALEVEGTTVIETHARNGYRFVAPVRRLGDDETPAGPWLFLGSTRFPLEKGENVLGRDPDCEVVIDLPTVSRRHARIRVEADAARVEDLESKNGTFLNEERLGREGATLESGDVLTLGQVRLVFRPSGSRDATKTAS